MEVPTLEDDYDDDGPPCNKKLRSSDFDLTIVLEWSEEKTANFNEENETTTTVRETKEYQCYGCVMAKHSKWIDTALSAGMKEQETRIIPLPDITPEVYEAALKWVEDACAARAMTVEDVFQVLEFYHKYEFSGGIQLCDQILTEYIQKQRGDESMPCKKNAPDDLDFLVHVVVEADHYHLPNAKKIGAKYLEERFGSVAIPFGGTMFTEKHVKQLQPLFVKGLLSCYGVDSKEELESPLFPKFFVSKMREFTMQFKIPQMVKLTGSGGPADGVFEYNLTMEYYEVNYDEDDDGDRLGQWQDDVIKYYIGREVEQVDGSEDWAIYGQVVLDDEENDNDEEGETVVLWKCPHSSNSSYPPKQPWIPVDPSVKGKQPKIEHGMMNY